MTKMQLDATLRNEFIDMVAEAIENSRETDVLRVSSSEIAVPCLDAEGNEKWIIVKFSIPRGTRNGQGGYDPYDGYTAAEDYTIDCEKRAQKKADSEAQKQAKIAKDEQKRAEKKALAEANKNLKELRKIKLTKKDKEEGDSYAKEYAPHELTEMIN